MARRLRMAKSTAHGLLHSLEAVGAVEQVHRRYRLGTEPHIQEALLYPDYAIFTVQNPSDPGAAFSLDWRDGFFGGAEMLKPGGRLRGSKLIGER